MWENFLDASFIGYPVWLIIKCLSLHFLLGFAVGLLVCAWILITFSVEDARIYHYLFWLCVALAIVSHVLEDYLIGWF